MKRCRFIDKKSLKLKKYKAKGKIGPFKTKDCVTSNSLQFNKNKLKNKSVYIKFLYKKSSENLNMISSG